MRQVRRPRQPRRLTWRTGHGVDSGFTLIEVIVALAILSLLSTSLLTLFIRAMATADGNSDRQAATSVANQVLENARTVSPRIPDGGAAGNSAIVRGRFSTAVTTQWNAATGTALLTPLGQTDKVWDPTATSGSTPTVPLSSTVLVGTTTFTAQTYLGTCMRAAGTASTACVPTAGAPAGSVLMFRVIVSVTWGTATACSGGPCQYVVSSLIDPSSDKTFNTNQAVPVATDDAATTPYNTLVNIDVLGNDTGSLDITSVVVATSPSHGTVSVRPDGQRRFYALRSAPFRELDGWLTPYRELWTERLDRFEAALAEKSAQRRAKERKKHT